MIGGGHIWEHDVEAISRAEISRRTFLESAAALGAAVTSSLALAKEERRMKVCVLGASGTVGNGIMRELLDGGHQVIAVSRSPGKLAHIRTQYGTKNVKTLVGDLASDESGAVLRDALTAQFGALDGVVAALSSPAVDRPIRVLGSSTDLVRQTFDANFYPHVVAAKALIPRLGPGAVYLGINGGLPDFVLPGMANLTMTQSALRSLYLAIEQEARESKVLVRLLGIFGLVATPGHPAKDSDHYISDKDVGRRAMDILLEPAQFPGPILAIRARAFTS
jgi:NAD(P)-dependent dehydrogenase (short-subunit alcohol dehydrogenase family)